MEAQEEFLESLTLALRHLNSPNILGMMPLAHGLCDEHASVSTRAMTLRALLLDALEELRPEGSANFNDVEWRIYLILHGRYVLRQSPAQMEQQLNLGDRQVRREHKRALAVLAELVRPRLAAKSSLATHDDAATSIRDAVHRLTPAPRLFGLLSLLEDVFGVAQRVLGDEGQLGWSVDPKNQTVFTDRGILSQLLLKLILPPSRPGKNSIHCEAVAGMHEGRVRLKISGVAMDVIGQDAQLIHMLANALGTSVTLSLDQGRAEFDLPAGGPLHTVLLVDDEPVAIELLRSILSGTEFDLKFETAPEAAVQYASELRPDVVVLDVMMPAMDGWALLQRLRALPQFLRTPILVYSVLEESALAEALGATRFLRKPVPRTQWLSVLRELVRG